MSLQVHEFLYEKVLICRMNGAPLKNRYIASNQLFFLHEEARSLLKISLYNNIINITF